MKGKGMKQRRCEKTAKEQWEKNYGYQDTAQTV